MFPNNEFNYTTKFNEQVLSGTTKDALWSLDLKLRLLEIKGSGEMQDYSLENLPQWCEYSDFINEIRIGEGISKLGKYSFYNLQYVEKIQINSVNLENLSNDKIDFNSGDNFTFYNTGRQWYGVQAIFGEKVKRIPNFLFWSYNSSSVAPYITEIVFKGNKIVEIGNHALSGICCLNLEIPEGVESLSVLAVSNSPTLNTLVLPDSLINLSAWGLAGNYYLEKVVIGKNIHSLENNLFFSCVNLKEVIIKGNINENSNIADIFSSNATNITLYGNETVESFVNRYNNSQNHQIKYSQDNI